MSCLFVYIFSIAAFSLRKQSWVAVGKVIWSLNHIYLNVCYLAFQEVFWPWYSMLARSCLPKIGYAYDEPDDGCKSLVLWKGGDCS